MRLHEIQPAGSSTRTHGPVAGHYHRHPDPVVPVYWLVDEIAPSVDQAIASHHCRYAAHADRPGPSVTSPFHRTTGSWSQARDVGRAGSTTSDRPRYEGMTPRKQTGHAKHSSDTGGPRRRPSFCLQRSGALPRRWPHCSWPTTGSSTSARSRPPPDRVTSPDAALAAVYARKSTEQNVADEDKSVTRQIELARTCAAQHGFEVPQEHVYVDDAISGAEFDRRPGLMRLLNGIRPRRALRARSLSPTRTASAASNSRPTIS